MRKLKTINVSLIALLILVFASSCSSLQTATVAEVTKPVYVGPKVVVPRFTMVDKVAKLNVGMSYDEVVSALGSAPYDVYTINFEAQKTTYIWYYKKVERRESPNVIETKEGGASGEEVICCQQMLYATFDANKKLEKLVTDAGKGANATKVVPETQVTIPVDQQAVPVTKKKMFGM